jgi:hypothetical protein
VKSSVKSVNRDRRFAITVCVALCATAAALTLRVEATTASVAKYSSCSAVISTGEIAKYVGFAVQPSSTTHYPAVPLPATEIGCEFDPPSSPNGYGEVDLQAGSNWTKALYLAHAQNPDFHKISLGEGSSAVIRTSRLATPEVNQYSLFMLTRKNTYFYVAVVSPDPCAENTQGTACTAAGLTVMKSKTIALAKYLVGKAS